MRWERLFADLEAQLGAVADADLEAEVRDRIRRERAAVAVQDRLVASLGCRLDLSLQGGSQESGVINSVGADWLLLDAVDGRDVLVVIAAIQGISGLSERAAAPDRDPTLADRLRVTYALRAIARDRAAVSVARRDGVSLHGTIDRVGADHVDLTRHDGADHPRRGNRTTTTVTIAAIASVSTRQSVSLD